eukprot:TRINITY_DN35_c0_g2_i1.p1 TRINITY_DN35_c0_g2~~TRINITY_DN35_c0_g2_i1.p1  ORF type:complete len:168 (+),score=3.46 TRINITY_DN35_c0_g2_i1:48-506(+)
MFHVTTMLDSEQQRRLVGNDTAIIYFHQSQKASFNSAAPRSLMSQVFLVVQPRPGGKYKVGCMSRGKIKPFHPKLPSNPTFTVESDEEKTIFKDFLLTKVINGYRTAIQSPPLDKMFKRPREASIINVAKAFPPPKKGFGVRKLTIRGKKLK